MVGMLTRVQDRLLFNIEATDADRRLAAFALWRAHYGSLYVNTGSVLTWVSRHPMFVRPHTVAPMRLLATTPRPMRSRIKLAVTLALTALTVTLSPSTAEAARMVMCERDGCTIVADYDEGTDRTSYGWACEDGRNGGGGVSGNFELLFCPLTA